MSKLLRVKCPGCGEVFDVAANSNCPKCNNFVTIPGDGVLQLYRMGSPVGIAVGYGIYINGQPYGHLGNCESIRIPLPYGTYNIHCTCGMTRKCDDLVVNITPDNNHAYAKAHIKMGFWSNKLQVEAAKAEEMPEL